MVLPGAARPCKSPRSFEPFLLLRYGLRDMSILYLPIILLWQGNPDGKAEQRLKNPTHPGKHGWVPQTKPCIAI